MTPFDRFLAGLHSLRHETSNELEELIAFAEIMAQKKNTLELDENGFFYCTASGPLEQVISVLEKQLGKLERIKKQKDTQH